MNIEGMFADETSAGPSARAERDILGVVLDAFWCKFRPLLWPGSHSAIRESSLAQDHLLKIERLVINVTSAGSP